ncbi:1,4-dihydroxy-2-naphthoate octaprenyltransferase [Gemmatimonadetes bacterium T265]|nr:1,4-dihydroxy-2-naphthoate octaprenyltransferase [Gemmatimonadetes bacterium T265]
MNPWILGARPRTLPAAVVPVVVGTACAAPHVTAWRALAALVVALALQVGVNYANDYSDGVRGTDAARVGPVRLVASGLKPAAAVRRAAFLAFGVAALAGLALALAADPRLVLVGLACILAAWFYTGGSTPYGYRGLGELSVFVFFGLVATIGTAYVQQPGWNVATQLAARAAGPVGLLACALLVVNNLRDVPSDAGAGKRTLAVRMGEARTRGLYAVLVLLPFTGLFSFVLSRPTALAALLALPLALGPIRRVRAGARGPALIPVLGETGRLQLAFGALLAVGLVVGAR